MFSPCIKFNKFKKSGYCFYSNIAKDIGLDVQEVTS